MTKKYGIYCENCNTLLNNEDNIFGTNLGQLYHSTCMGGINHGKSSDCQPQMLFKMNLKFADTPTLTTEAEEEITQLRICNITARQSVQQLKAKIKTLEDALLVQDRLKDDVNKLMDCAVKLENSLSINVIDKAADIVNNTSQKKSNKRAYDENNLDADDSSLTEEAEGRKIEYNNSNIGLLLSVQQLESRIKTIEDALLRTKTDGNKLIVPIERVEKSKAVDKATDGGNNTTQDPKASKETNNESDLSGGEQHNDTENVASASKDHHTCTISEEKQEVLDLRWNCVYIENPKRNCKSLDEAFSYVHELANAMDAQIADNSVIHIDIDYPTWYVYFRDADSKKEFLKNRFIEYNPNIGHNLRILDYTDCGIVDIMNIENYQRSSEDAFHQVGRFANVMGMTNIMDFIDHIDVYKSAPDFLTYSVRFNREDVKNAFLQKKDILKQLSEMKYLEILDRGGHTSCKYNVNDFSMAAASANVIGVAELMGLSLSTDNVKRIYVLNVKNFSYYNEDLHISLVVEFSNNDLKNKFLTKKSELKRILKDWSTCIRISDIEKEGGNIVSIKYYKDLSAMFSATSFIGLAKQLGFSFIPDQTDRFIELSQFISKASS